MASLTCLRGCSGHAWREKNSEEISPAKAWFDKLTTLSKVEGRLFSYGDAQRYRLGVNHHLIPVNAARCPVHSYHRDGAMRVDGNHGGTLGYEPNSYGEWQEQPDYREPPLSLEGAADHWNHREDKDYYSQPGALFRLMSADQKRALFENTARSVGGAPKEIQIRHIGNCLKADPAYGKGLPTRWELH